MEEKEDTLAMPPFWLQNGQANHRNSRRLRRTYSLFLTSTSLLVLLLVISLVFIFIVVPTLHSFASHILKPHSVKRSWDSLNLVLVLFAIICGFLSKNTNETPRSHDAHRSFSNAPQQQEYANSFSRLRSFNSYPDLRQESPWVAADERWRFYDDTHFLLRHRRPRPEEEEEEELGVKNVAMVTTGEVASALPLPEQQPPPSPSPSPATRTRAVRRNAKRTYQAIGQAEVIEKLENLQPPPSTPPPPPLPAERKSVQSKKKRGIATREFLTSLRGKNKKQRQKSIENFESILNSQPFPLASPPPPSGPPPPPPPPSVFHNLFSSKKSKHKKRHLAPPPSLSKTKPRLSNKREHSYSLEGNVITGNESPLIPIPPPPPFKMPAWKFRVQGDFVRIDSIGSSRSGSPDLDEVVDSPTKQEQQASQCNSPSPAPDGGEPAISLFCPSPDVDTKAHTFIERFRAGLRMEKMNSMKEKQGIGRSNLGSSANPESNEETRPS